ncbi:MAG: bluetail domain-containing putative surface protein [Leptolyngbyaceae cyanobacterium]
MATITGTNLDDSLVGAAGTDRISGGNGNDQIFGGSGNDTIFGNNGDDTIFGDSGNDVISGGSGNDIIYDGAGFDTLSGGAGDDIFKLFDNNRFDANGSFNPDGKPEIFGGRGYDIADATGAIEAIRFAEFTFAIASIEEFMGSRFGDSVNASSVDFDLVLSGAAGNDTLIGGSGNDTLSGGSGNDIIQGGAGADVLVGGVSSSPTSINSSQSAPNEAVEAAATTDSLTGEVSLNATGVNSDRFVFTDPSDSLLAGFDRIQDLEIGNDVIDWVTPIAADSVAQLGEAASLTATAIATVLSPAAFASSGAATFTAADRTFLALNNDVAGFQAATDSIIEITGYSGNLSALSVV